MADLSSPSNCLVGGLDAVLAFPGAAQYEAEIRLAVLLVYSVIVVIVLYIDVIYCDSQSDWLGLGLGCVMVVMFLLLLLVVFIMGINGQLDAHRYYIINFKFYSSLS